MMVDPMEAAAAVITAYSAVRWLYNHCFDPSNAADRRYREFGAAIRGLVQAIQNIESNFVNGWRDDGYNAVDDARAIKEEFARLLEECEQLLARHARFEYNRANVLQNITWAANVQPRINQLLARIADQMRRATFIYSTLSYNRQSEMAARIDYITQRLDPTTPHTLTLDITQHSIPPQIIDKFRRATLRKQPLGYESPDKFPFRTGLNTLRIHLEQSTVQSRSGEQQTKYQHISLLKAQWLLQTIKNLNHFQHLERGTRDWMDVQEVEHKIAVELTRPDLTFYTVEELLSQPPNHFFIWDTIPRNVPRDLMQPFAEEKEIMSVELPAPPNYQQCRLVVFRDLGHRRGTMIRLVRQSKQNGQLLYPHSHPIDIFSHVFKPLYAFDTSSEENLSIELCNADGLHGEVYEFKELSDVFKLQWALSNYNVFSDFTDVGWTITRSMKGNVGCNGSRIQLWWFDPDNQLEKAEAEVNNTPTSRNSGRTSIISAMTGAASHSILQDSESLKTHSNYSHDTTASETEIVEAIPPYEPLLVVFSSLGRCSEYLSLQLHGQMYIDPAKCDCKRREATCRRSVLRSDRGVKCQVKRTSVGRGASPRDIPNLNIFARPFRKGGPQHPLMNQAESVPTRELTLDFADATQRRDFTRQFKWIITLQRSREDTHAMLFQRAVYLSSKPRGVGNGRDRIVGTIGGSDVSSCLSTPIIRTQSDPASRPEPFDTVITRPDSAICSSLGSIHELSGTGLMNELPGTTLRHELSGTSFM